MNRIIYKTLVICFILNVLSCDNKKKESPTLGEENSLMIEDFIQVTQAQFTQSKMKLDSMKAISFPTIVKVNGMIDVPPENRAVVNSIMGGYIKTTPLLIGDRVTKGQALVTLENLEFVALQQQYLETNEQLTYLKSEYDRQVTMKKEKITSQKNYLKAESAYKIAIARKKGLEKRLKMLNISPSKVQSGAIGSIVSIYAPISGSVTKVNVTKGSYVSPSTEILEIIDNNHIHLELSVFEKDIMKLKKGQSIKFKIPEASKETFNAKVYLVGTTIEENRTIKVHAHLEDESSNNFLTGMFVEAEIIIDSDFTKALPSESIIEIDNKNFVLMLDKKEDDIYYLIQKEVEVKDTYEGYSMIDVKDNFEPETLFLTKGAFNLLGE